MISEKCGAWKEGTEIFFYPYPPIDAHTLSFGSLHQSIYLPQSNLHWNLIITHIIYFISPMRYWCRRQGLPTYTAVVVKIDLFEKQRDKERQRKRSSHHWFTSQMAITGGAGLNPGIYAGSRDPSMWAIPDCFPRHLSREWTRSREAGIQINPPMEFWHIRRHFNHCKAVPAPTWVTLHLLPFCLFKNVI